MSEKISKLTIKQEKFCQKYLETGNASEAYRQSYDAGNMKPETVNRSAKELLDDHKITARIKELQELSLKRHEITLDTITRDFIEARDLAAELKKPEPMINATAHIARLHGIGTDDPSKKAAANVTLNFNEDMMFSMLQRFAKKIERRMKGEVIENTIENTGGN